MPDENVTPPGAARKLVSGLGWNPDVPAALKLELQTNFWRNMPAS